MTRYKEKKTFAAILKYAQHWHAQWEYNETTGTYDPQYTIVKPQNHNYRDVFTEDRDRIMYTPCFLRLSAKTQIFKAGNNDHLRTRLTHTLEVSQIARTIATELGLNLELTEAIALGHDVGHTPFGHAGERQLNSISQGEKTYIEKHNDEYGSDQPVKTLMDTELKNYKGFKHNQQSVRTLVDYSPGIELTNYCLYGIRNHSNLLYNGQTPENMAFYDSYNHYCCYQNEDTGKEYPSWSFEAIAVYWADEIAQRHHDIEDAHRSKLIDRQGIVEKLEGLFKYFDSSNKSTVISEYDQYCSKEHFIEKYQLLKSSINDERLFNKYLSSFVVDFYVSAIIRELLYCMDQISELPGNVILTPEDFEREYLNLSEKEVFSILKLREDGAFRTVDHIFQHELENVIIPSYDVQRQDAKGKFITRKLVNAYITNPQQLPDHYLKRIFNEELPRCLNRDQIDQIRIAIRDSKLLQPDFKEWDTVCARTALKTLSERPQTYQLIYPLIFRIIFDYISGMTDSFAQEEYIKLY